MAITKEKAAFSIDISVKQALEAAVPKSKRSQFVERAISEALSADKRRQVAEMLRNLPSYATDGEPVVETLRKLRKEREDYLASRHR